MNIPEFHSIETFEVGKRNGDGTRWNVFKIKFKKNTHTHDLKEMK
jgi:hypothetical protein